MRVTHVPTGVSAQAYEERSQLKNRQRAIKRLRDAIALQVRRPSAVSARAVVHGTGLCLAGVLECSRPMGMCLHQKGTHFSGAAVHMVSTINCTPNVDSWRPPSHCSACRTLPANAVCCYERKQPFICVSQPLFPTTIALSSVDVILQWVCKWSGGEH